MKQTIARRTLTRPVTRTVREDRQTEWGTSTSIKSVPDGTESGTVELRIDVDKLLNELGLRALRRKGKRAVLAGGLIEAVVIGGKSRQKLAG